ncbi:CLUMA_CG019942, isoform A [Clunio marinus]|uniref:CLUMA_CG019942, isoform A n=1 Tax=Clunio marinus TaxID=568069 RepID=A0A1J1J230_9DIPT|nr:CLUMA_CG019942, isoform A [Clunio marinus]
MSCQQQQCQQFIASVNLEDRRSVKSEPRPVQEYVIGTFCKSGICVTTLHDELTSFLRLLTMSLLNGKMEM